MNDLVQSAGIPAMRQEDIDLVARLSERELLKAQIEIPTFHVIHAGLYSRTITIPKGSLLTAALIKIPTLVVMSGHAAIYIGDEFAREVVGNSQVLSASANRKQAIIALEDTTITMIFPTQAKTVAEAEAEFTDEADKMFSRIWPNVITITGE